MKNKFFHSWLTVSLLLAIIASLFTFQSAHAAGVLFVSPTGLTSGSCNSWANACTLQYALSVASDGDQIWVKQGKYKPTNLTTDRTASFELKNGVEIYGGFVGTETIREFRNPPANLTILSGDIDGNDVNSPFTGLVVSTDNIVGGNSYHVVTADFVDDSAVLDGFTINAGHANSSAPHQSGAGMYNYNSSPTLANLYFIANLASGSGGGMHNYDQSSPSLENVTFSANKADNGGGMYNYDVAHPTLANVIFQNNLATNTGGGMMNVGDSAPTLTDVTFHSNAAEVGGGGMTNYNDGNPTLTNVTFTENTAPYGGGGMYNTTSSPTLNNVTFQENSDSYSGGGGMFNSSSNPTLTDVTFRQNTAYFGAGIYNIDSDPIMSGVGFFSNAAETVGGGIYNNASSPSSRYGHFSGNSANRGGGMYNLNSSPSFTSTVFNDNAAVTDGGGMFNILSTPTLVNATFVGNQAGEYGGGIYNSEQSPTFINITVANNSSIIAGGGIYNDYSLMDLVNSIVWENTAPSGPQTHNVGIHQPTILYSDIQGCGGSGSWAAICGTDGGGNIDADPLFVGLGAHDVRLLLTSPAIDAGKNSNVPGSVTLDLNSSSRFMDVASVADTGSGTTPIVDMGAFEAKATLHVAPLQKGIGDCSDWDNACTIWNAFVEAYGGQQIWVEQGVYKPTWDSGDREASFTLKNGVEVYGGFAGNEMVLSARNLINNITVLSGDIDGNDTTTGQGIVADPSDIAGGNSYHVVIGSDADSSAILDGFYITGGSAYGPSSETDSGGGMFNKNGSPTIRSTVFVGNEANSLGGGMYNDNSSPTLVDVIVKRNEADMGGGMHNTNSHPSLNKVTFQSNSGYSAGGGMYNQAGSNPNLTNVTFSDNTSSVGGGIFNSNSAPILTNVTFSNNSALSQGGGMYNANGSSPTLKNAIIADSFTGGDCINDASSLNPASSHNLVEDSLNDCDLTGGVNGNIVGADPLLGPLADSAGSFTPTHALLSNSPAIDAGTNTGCPATDQRGVARPQGAGCDIGAYEYEPAAFTKSAPANSATGQSLSPILSWQTSSGAVSYEYCYSSAAGPCTKWNSVGANTSVTLNGLAPNYTYYWQVRTVDSGGTTEADGGTWWSFTTTAASACTWPSYTAPATPTFGDVPMDVGHWSWVERLANSTITAGCGAGNYCPFSEVVRAQMAIFLLRGKHCGNAYTPPAVGATTGFGDVPLGATYAPWVKQLAAEGVTAGCGNGNFCPLQVVNRAQMAIFLLRAKHGSTYSPPAVGATTGFGDVPLNVSYAPWVKQLAAEGVTAGCGSGNFCPLQNVNRAQMATFLARAFGLP